MNLIQLENVSKTFYGKQHTTALNNINFSIKNNEFVSIIGKTGCGKTTLLRIIAGFEKATNGKVLYNGHEVKKPKMECAYVFQGFDQLLPWKTVKENVEYPLLLSGFGTKKECEKKAEYYLSLMGLTNSTSKDIFNRFPHTLSGGEKQRVAIARALAMRPKVILMDEPFANLDLKTKELLYENLLEIREKLGITFCLITHDINEAIKLSTRILALKGNPSNIVLDFPITFSKNKDASKQEYSYIFQKLCENY